MRWLRWPAVLVPVLVLALAGTLTWLLWPQPEEDSTPRERRYQAFTACLLTDDNGLAGDEARAAWAGMQAVSADRLIKVQYLAVEGPQTPANALAYFNTLALEGCGIVVAVGEAPVAAVGQGRGRFKNPRYVTVGSERTPDGVTAVPAGAPEGIRAGVETAVRDASVGVPTK